MESYVFLLSIAVILLSTKILGDATNKVNLTQVVGALLAGVLLGPSCLGLITETDFIAKTAEIGVILLMFTAGLDTDIQEMKKKQRVLLCDSFHRRTGTFAWRHSMLLLFLHSGIHKLQ